MTLDWTVTCVSTQKKLAKKIIVNEVMYFSYNTNAKTIKGQEVY